MLYQLSEINNVIILNVEMIERHVTEVNFEESRTGLK